MTDGPRTPRRPWAWLRVSAPWLLAGALIALLLAGQDLGAIREQLERVGATRYAGFVLGSVLLILVADSAGTWRAFRFLAPEISLGRIMVVRGASYLPTTINYHMGAAYMTYLLARGYGVPFLEIFAGTLAIYASLLADLVLVALVSVVTHASELSWLSRGTLVACGLGALYAAVLALEPRWLCRFPTIRLLCDIGLPGHLKLMMWRMPHVLVLYATLWGAYAFFDIHIPLTAGLTIIPTLLLVSAVPLTPQGIGTREVVALQLLEPYAPEPAAAAILAAGAAWSVVGALAQAAFGLALTRSASRVFADGAATPQRAPAGPGATELRRPR